MVKAGPFIDGLIAESGAAIDDGDTETYRCTARSFSTHGYDVRRGVSGLYPVGALLRHRVPAQMYELRTRCGRAMTLTGDHNLWVLRDGMPALIRTDDARTTDFLPVPLALESAGDLRELDVLPYLADTSLSVFAEESVLDYVANGGRADFVAVMQSSGIDARAKLFAIRKGIRGRGIKVGQFLRLGLYRTGRPAGWYVGSKMERCRLPAALPLTEEVLRLVGLYIAEGNGQDRYFILANRHPVLRQRIEQSLSSLGIPFHVRRSSDYAVSSTALALLLRKLCGGTAAAKRLPDFWPQLSDASLGTMLRAYFDGDGTVGSSGEVIATTASRLLASDLAYALKRFGIHARLREQRKRATNSSHAGGDYHYVCVSGQDDLERFANFVGFDHPDKAGRLRVSLRRDADTNVDVVPIRPELLAVLRRTLRLTMLELAEAGGCARSMVSLIESGRRRPSRALLNRLLGALALRGQASPCRGNLLVEHLETSEWSLQRTLDTRQERSDD